MHSQLGAAISLTWLRVILQNEILNPCILALFLLRKGERGKGKRMYLLSAERCSHVQELILRLRVITAWKKVNKEGRGVGRSKT